MKRLPSITGGLLALLTLAALAVVLALAFGGLQKNVKPASQAFRSPIETPTQPAYPPPATPIPQPTPLPTSTRPPEPPTRTPTPTFTPAPPTPTPEPLPTLIPGLQTFLYATTGERWPEIYRVQLDPATNIIASPAYRVNTTGLWRSRVYVEGLHPSPDGRQVAVSWVYGEGGTFVSILNANDGTFIPLFGETAPIDQRVEFLDWSPDGNKVLALGRMTNPDLGGRAWLVDVNTHECKDLAIEQINDPQQLTDASFSPDGQAIAYALSNCYRCGSEIWSISLDGAEQKLLYKEPDWRVENVRWSPEGTHVAFTRWRESEAQEFTIGETHTILAVGELWVMDPRRDTRHLLSPVMTGYYKRFTPVWSPDGRSIAFIGEESQSGRQANEPSFNVYIADVSTREVRQLTHFQNTQVLEPIFSPDGSMVAFVATLSGVPEQFEPWLVAADGRGLRRFDERATLILNTRAAAPAIAWLPEFFPGGQR